MYPCTWADTHACMRAADYFALAVIVVLLAQSHMLSYVTCHTLCSYPLADFLMHPVSLVASVACCMLALLPISSTFSQSLLNGSSKFRRLCMTPILIPSYLIVVFDAETFGTAENQKRQAEMCTAYQTSVMCGDYQRHVF